MSQFNQWLASPFADELVAKLTERKKALYAHLEDPRTENLHEVTLEIRAAATVIRQVESHIAQARKAVKNVNG